MKRRAGAHRVAVVLLALFAGPAATVFGQDFSEFPIPTAGSFPQGIAAGSDGALWFTESNGNKIGRVTTAGIITEFTVPTAGGSPQSIAAGPDGALWFTSDGSDSIGRVEVLKRR
jgi:virginiamycin B lyase